jgi:hypothetical protein
MTLRRLRAGLAACALGLLSCAGTGTEVLAGLGLPAAVSEAQVLDRIQHGGYVVASLQFQDSQLRFLFPSSSECFRVLQIPGRVEYTREGKVGDVLRGVTHCRAVGIASLETWRDRASRPLSAALPAGDEARFNPFYVDAGVILVRGSFPQATRIGWRPTDDVVAMLPRNPACDPVASAGAGKMAFWEAAITGLADPL